MKAMAPDPELRYGSAREFAEDLRAFRAGEPVRAVAEDLDATRRTARRPDAEDDATRRTTPRGDSPDRDATRQTARGGPSEHPAVEWPHVSRPKQARPLPIAFMRAVWALGLAVVLFVAWSLVSSYRLYARGSDFARQLETEQITDPNEIWNRVDGTFRGPLLVLVIAGPAQAGEAEAGGSRRPRDRHLSQRRAAALRERLEARPDRAGARPGGGPRGEVRGKLRLCDGHLARINGVAHHNAAT